MIRGTFTKIYAGGICPYMKTCAVAYLTTIISAMVSKQVS